MIDIGGLIVQKGCRMIWSFPTKHCRKTPLWAIVLSKLKRFEFAGGKLVMEQQGVASLAAPKHHTQIVRGHLP